MRARELKQRTTPPVTAPMTAPMPARMTATEAEAEAAAEGLILRRTATVVWQCPETGKTVSVHPLDPTKCPVQGCISELHINCLPTRLDVFPPVLRVKLDCNYAAAAGKPDNDLPRYIANRIFADGKSWRPRIQEVLTLQIAGQSATYHLRGVVCHDSKAQHWFCPVIKDSGDGCLYSYDGYRHLLKGTQSCWIKLASISYEGEELAISMKGTASISSIIYVRAESESGGGGRRQIGRAHV